VAHKWQSRAVEISIPLATARTMWTRALQWDVSEGGRFEVRDCRTLLIWPGYNGPFGPAGDAAPLGSVSLRWNTPNDRQATITRIAWHPTKGNEELVWQSLEALAGWAPVDSRA